MVGGRPRNWSTGYIHQTLEGGMQVVEQFRRSPVRVIVSAIAAGGLGLLSSLVVHALATRGLLLPALAGTVAGLLAGLVPYFVGRRKGQTQLARMALWSSVGAGAAGGALLAVPVVLVFAIVVWRRPRTARRPAVMGEPLGPRTTAARRAARGIVRSVVGTSRPTSTSAAADGPGAWSIFRPIRRPPDGPCRRQPPRRRRRSRSSPRVRSRSHGHWARVLGLAAVRGRPGPVSGRASSTGRPCRRRSSRRLTSRRIVDARRHPEVPRASTRSRRFSLAQWHDQPLAGSACRAGSITIQRHSYTRSGASVGTSRSLAPVCSRRPSRGSGPRAEPAASRVSGSDGRA